MRWTPNPKTFWYFSGWHSYYAFNTKMQSCLGKGRVYNLKCEASLNLSRMFFCSQSPITLRNREKPIRTKIGHSNNSWHTNTQWKSLEIKTAYLPLCVKHTRGLSRRKIVQGVLPFSRDVREQTDKTLFMALQEPWSWTEMCKLVIHRKRALIQREWKVILP